MIYFLIVYMFLFCSITASNNLIYEEKMTPIDMPFDLFDKQICNDKEIMYTINQLNKEYYNFVFCTTEYQKKLTRIARNICKETLICHRASGWYLDYYNLVNIPKCIKKKEYVYKKQEKHYGPCVALHKRNKKTIKSYYKKIYPLFYLKYAQTTKISPFKHSKRGFENFHKNHSAILKKIKNKVIISGIKIKLIKYFLPKNKKSVIFAYCDSISEYAVQLNQQLEQDNSIVRIIFMYHTLLV